jgi:hypothetical protein
MTLRGNRFFTTETNQTHVCQNVSVVIQNTDKEEVSTKTREIKPETKKEIVYKKLLDYTTKRNWKELVQDTFILDNSHLGDLIKTMTDADAVEFDYNIDVNCCGIDTGYNVVDGIIVVKDGIRNDFKQAYNDWYRLCVDTKINLHFTHD